LQRGDDLRLAETQSNHPQTSPDADRIILPSYGRLFVLHWVIPMLGWFTGWGARALIDILRGQTIHSFDFDGWFWGYAAGCALVSLLIDGLNRDWSGIQFEPTVIVGPRKKRMLRNEIDLARTWKQNAFERFFQSHRIWDVHGKNIEISGWFFDADQIDEIRKEVGVE